MQRQRSVSFWGAPTPAGALLLLSSGLLFCCGTDEALHPHPTTPIEAGGVRGDAGGAHAGATSGAGGSSGHPPIAGSSSEAGAENQPGGASSGGSAQAGGSPAAAGAGGEDSGPLLEQLSFCPRVPQKFANAGDVAREYNHAVYDDCRTRWVTDLYLQQAAQVDFLNDLVDWNMNFWGCEGEPVANFALIYGEAPLSAGDAALLIDHYVAVATVELTMSPLEIEEMRSALGRLSKPLIADPSMEPSQPRCDTGAGGAGSAAGAAGEPPVGGGGAADPGETAGQGGGT